MRLELTLILAVFATACRGGGSGGGETTTGETDGDSADGPVSTSGPGDDSTPGDDSSGDDADTGEPEPPPPTSPKANLKFKGPRRLAADLGHVLTLAPDEVCLELGELSCTEDVHPVTLGGVEPYTLGIYEPAATSAVTTPIATDRVVLAACARRVDADLSGDEVVFDLPLSGAALADPEGPEVAAAIDRLYAEGLLRHPTAAETAALVDLYAPVAATGTSAPARDWAVAACFATLTTMEFLFY